MSAAQRELLAPREDVWRFLAEPYHLADWWPGILGVEPGVRGFVPGARWKVRVRTRNIFTGRGERETMLLIREIGLYEIWSWHVLSSKLDVELRLRARDNHTIVTCTTSGRSRRLPELALQRLHDLIQTAAT